jgi:tetratricopeptide (TPR) repeat protein
MTITYCGKCGSANGNSARYCRQCGVELSSQTALSQRSTPLNVEFFPIGGTKDIREDQSQSEQSEQITISASGELSIDQSPSRADQGEAQPDPVAISKSLRRVRASGSLILEVASKKKQDEMNAIIAMAIEGFDQHPDQPEKLLKASKPPHPPNPVFGKLKRRRPLSLPPKDRSKIPSATQPLVAVAETIQAVWRKAVDAMTTPARVSDSAGPAASGNSIAPTGPSIVLAQASGLNTKRNLSPKLIGGLIAIALLISIGVYQVVRDRLLSPDQTANSERELQTAEEQSEKNVQMGKEAKTRGLYDDALSYFNKALSMTPNRSEVIFLIAKTHSAAGQTEDAVRAFRAVLRIDPENLEARLSLAQIYRALGNWNSAYQEFQRIIALDQGSKEASVALGAIEEKAGVVKQVSTPPPSSGVRSRSVAKKSPVLPPAAAAQSQMKFFSQEVPATQTIRPPAPESDKKDESLEPRAVAESRKNLGLRFLQVKLYRAAINEFLASLKLMPDDKNIYYFIASAYSGLNQPEQAHEYYKRVDNGPYLQVSQAGAKKTEKAAREAAKQRRSDMMKNDLGIELQGENRREPGGGNPFSKTLNIFR